MNTEKLQQPLAANAELKRLGSYLVEAGLLTQLQVRVALADQQAIGLRFGDVLVLQGWIKQQTLEYFMQKLVLPERKVAAKSDTGPISTASRSHPRCTSSEPKVVARCKAKGIVKNVSGPRWLAGLNG